MKRSVFDKMGSCRCVYGDNRNYTYAIFERTKLLCDPHAKDKFLTVWKTLLHSGEKIGKQKEKSQQYQSQTLNLKV
jgi:hypothetical protein